LCWETIVGCQKTVASSDLYLLKIMSVLSECSFGRVEAEVLILVIPTLMPRKRYFGDVLVKNRE